MAAKNGGNEFCEKSQVDTADALWVKNLVEIVLSRTISKILKIFYFQC